MPDGDSLFRPGDILKADKLNWPTNQAERDRNATVGAPLAKVTTAAGPLVTYVAQPVEIVALITSGGAGGIYGGKEQVPQTGGTWVDGVRTFDVSGVPLREISGNTSVPTGGTVWVIAKLAPSSNEFLFQFAACQNPTYPPTLQQPITSQTPRRIQAARFIAATSTANGTPLALSAPIGP